MKTVCVIQARMGSTRLPEKIAADICGKPMLARVVEKARQFSGVDAVVVATSTLPRDDFVVTLCNEMEAPVYRGSERDVLSRYVGAAREFAADLVVRVTADCPLLDPKVSSEVIRRFKEQKPDYASNTLVRTYPKGLDTEILTAELLREVAREASTPYDREHVTPYIYNRPERFKLLSIRGKVDNSALRWTVDTPEDLARVRALWPALYSD